MLVLIGQLLLVALQVQAVVAADLVVTQLHKLAVLEVYTVLVAVVVYLLLLEALAHKVLWYLLMMLYLQDIGWAVQVHGTHQLQLIGQQLQVGRLMHLRFQVVLTM